MSQIETVVVLGASNKPDRYANKAQKLLRAHGHTVLPVHPLLSEIEGLPVLPSLAAIQQPVDTVTMYIGPERSAALADELVALKPKRVIFNPGSESELLEQRLRAAGIPFEEACTLVLLNTGQF
ncbi:CoA-binding protein [Permianibacter sp. IMCC34836]|uniref:CoA-binding protein n=1 Tax=Permianibacter fluminis TaxID=2738515 RepID=UPI0015568BE1|nr:CoA-binding protein [Permianibacter fluminis]NQD36456.1 CoA-binding protein [Permianibacter fluminis]